MWMPTHVHVTVQRAMGLLTKGKNRTNDCFVTIALGKTKYQTSVKEKASPNLEWHEECELSIPEQGNKAELILTVLHRNFVGVDEFLGRVSIPLRELDIYETPKNKWYTLQAKPGKEGNNKDRGKLEAKIDFTVKSGSLTDISKVEKHKSSMGQISHVAQSIGGSLLSLGNIKKRKGIKNVAKSIGSKIHLRSKKGKDLDESSSIGSIDSLKKHNNMTLNNFNTRQTKEDADPGVISEDEDEFTFDELSHKSSDNSSNHNINLSNLSDSENLNLNNDNTISGKFKKEKMQNEWESKLFGKNKKKEEFMEVDNLCHNSNELIIMRETNGGVTQNNINNLSNEVLQKFQNKSREELILYSVNLQSELDIQKKKLKDLEDYLDDLLLRVMETTPKLLQNPYVNCKLEF